MTLRKRGPKPLPALAMDAMTKTATNIGAMAFKALTNNVPRMPIAVADGINKPNAVPITNPIRIRITRLVSVHFLTIDDDFPIPFPLKYFFYKYMTRFYTNCFF